MREMILLWLGLFGGGFELSLVFRACFVGALLDRGLGPPASTVAVLVFRACFAGVSWVLG